MNKSGFNRDEVFIVGFLFILVAVLACVQCYITGFNRGKYEDQEVIVIKKNCKDKNYTWNGGEGK